MSYVSIGVAGASAISGVVGMTSGGKAKKRAAREAANIKEVPLTNIADELKVSTLGAKTRQQGQSVLEATQVASLQEGGTRAILGGVGAVEAGGQAVNRDIAANLDEQQKGIDQIRAEDSVRIRMTKEQRNQAKLAALSSQYNAGATAQQQGMGNIISGAGMAASAVASSDYYSADKKAARVKARG
jgi:hypothetical protein